MKTSYQEFRQILAQVNDCALAFIGNRKYDISVCMVNFEGIEDFNCGVSVHIHYTDSGIAMSLDFATYHSEEENYAELKKLWDFVSENTEG